MARGDTSDIEIPVPAIGRSSGSNLLFGSDVIAETLQALSLPYIALTPGSSYRGLHDSLVNHLGNSQPQMLVCLHEEHAVAIAHGWAKVTGTPMAAAVHANVGLLHASMAVFNAWCDRMPIILIGATGPVDAARRRPWIDWIHTARDQGAILRGFIKWDDQPASPAAAREALLRGAFLARSAPMGPVYINLDSEMQEARLEHSLPPIDAGRFIPAITTAAPDALLRQTAELLRLARRPVLLMGRVSRDPAAWEARVALAERIGAKVVTDLKIGAAFPTDHPLHAGAPGIFATAATLDCVREADVILSLDWVDLAGLLSSAASDGSAATIIQASLDHHLHNGWSMDHQGLPPVDVFLAADPEAVVAGLLDCLKIDVGQTGELPPPAPARRPAGGGPVAVSQIADGLRLAAGARKISLLHLPLAWDGACWPFRHPLDFLGSDGGGGVGGGPGISVGAALALRDGGADRLPVAIVGDGDFLMGVTALWTAVHYRIALLMVIANNSSFFNDEVHQERVARMRGRPVENKWIGQRIADPEIDLCGMARAQGAEAFGPVSTPEALLPAFIAAIGAVEAGAVAVVDVRVAPGYTPAMAAGVSRS
jgi:thiamine pyrophosphate-dependent acetolactate synthase large subunit-like protein